MAKATRARARRAYTHAHLPVSKRYSYTPELLADGRRRYEETDEPIVDIAADFGCHNTTFQRMANREHWVRYKPPPRDLAPAAKLAAQAEALTAVTLPPRSGGEGRLVARERDEPGWGEFADAKAPPTPDPSPQGGGEETAARSSQDIIPPAGSIAARLHAAVLNELTAVEAMRARMKNEPQKPADADITARTLARLTDTIAKLQRLQAAAPSPASGPAYDDMPADLDEFRHALARRIEAFFASRPDAGDAGEPVADGADEA